VWFDWFKPPMLVIDRTKAVAQLVLVKTQIKKNKNRKSKRSHKQLIWTYVASWCSVRFCVVVSDWFCTGHCVTVPLNVTCLQCLQHFCLEHIFKLYFFPVPEQTPIGMVVGICVAVAVVIAVVIGVVIFMRRRSSKAPHMCVFYCLLNYLCIHCIKSFKTPIKFQ